jgi:hypothetical protein
MKFRITVTFSKIMMFLILVAGTWYSLINKEATVITLAIITVAAGLGWKQQKDKELNKIEKDSKKAV